MTLVCTPDIGVALPPEGLPYPLLRERAQAACATIDVLLGVGLDPEVLVPTPEDEVLASQIVESFAKDEEKTSQAITTDRLSTISPASLLLVREQLDEFGHAVVERAVQIRHLVTNKLLLESANPDPKIRIRALELLGKHSDVGLFSERSEVTITHQTTDELKEKLRAKLQRLIRRTSGEVSNHSPAIEMGGEIIDVDVELGLSTEKPLDTPSESENKPEICAKTAKTGEYYEPEPDIDPDDADGEAQK